MARTPADRWNEHVLRLRKECQAILEVSDTVRYAGAINKHGRTLTGIMRPGTRPLLTRDNARDEFFVISTMLGLRDSSSEDLGGFTHAVLYHRGIAVLVVLRDGITFYVSIDPAADLDSIVTRIKERIRQG
jgi:hypothetical protein